MTTVGLCDFCVGSKATCAYLVPAFVVTLVAAEEFHNAAGAWGACDNCAALIERDELDQLVERCLRTFELREPTEEAERILTRANLRAVHGQILRRRNERTALDDPRVVALLAKEGEPLGFAYHKVPGGIELQPLYGPGPFPLEPT